MRKLLSKSGKWLGPNFSICKESTFYKFTQPEKAVAKEILRLKAKVCLYLGLIWRMKRSWVEPIYLPSTLWSFWKRGRVFFRIWPCLASLIFLSVLKAKSARSRSAREGHNIYQESWLFTFQRIMTSLKMSESWATYSFTISKIEMSIFGN